MLFKKLRSSANQKIQTIQKVKNMSKKLSIAIPTYNRLPYLKECINSILNQTFQDFSIFVFDNASNEPVEEELKKINNKRINFIGSNKNIGQAENINRILSYPFKSKYLTIFHDDDLMHPRMLELQVSFLDANNDIVFVTSDLNRVFNKNIHNFKSLIDNEIKYVIYKNNYEFTKAIMSWLRCAFDSAMYKTKVIGNSRIEFNRFSDFIDMAFLMEISKKGLCAFIAAPLVNYRIHSGQDSKLAKEKYEDGAIEALYICRENLPAILNKNENKLFCKYSLNFLLRAYAHINNGFLDFVRFIKKCRQKELIKYSYFRYIDMSGIVSMTSIILKNEKIFDAARSFRNFLWRV